MADLWIEVDLDAVIHNYRQILTLLSPGCNLMAVVKADAYGLGAVEVAQALEESGCGSFAVTKVEEALILRDQGITGNILVLGPSAPEDWAQAVKGKIELTVSCLDYIPVLNAVASGLDSKAGIHLKIETGMGRTGFLPEQLESLAQQLNQAESVEVRGVYTHFARSGVRDHSFTRNQHEKFAASVKRLELLGIHAPLKHVCNSAAFMDFPEYHYNLVRIGTLLAGHFPSPAFAGKLNLQDPWIAKSKIMHLQKVPKGTYAGYQSLYKSRKGTTLAVIAAGYADGFGVEPKLVPQGIMDLAKIILKNTAALMGVQLGREKVLLNGKAAPIAGKIGMQLTILDVGNSFCKLGDEVVIPLRRTSANPRIPRLYKTCNKFIVRRVIQEGFLQIVQEYSSGCIF